MLRQKILNMEGWIFSALIIAPIVAVALLPLWELTQAVVISVTAYCSLLLTTWMFAAGPVLINESRTLKARSETLFLVNAGFVAAYFLFLTVLMWEREAFGHLILNGLFLVILSLYCFLAMVHVTVSVAGSLVSIEKRRGVKLNEIVLTLLEIWTFPIGLMFVHNRVRKAIKSV